MFIAFFCASKENSGRWYQTRTIYEKCALEKRHPRRNELLRADIVAPGAQFELVELISSMAPLCQMVQEGSLEIHLNHWVITNYFLARFALRGESDLTRLRSELISHSNSRVFRYATKIQDLANDRKFRRATTRKYVSI